MKKICYYDNKNIVADNLKKIRRNSKISQSDLAAKLQTMNLNIDQQMISKIEKNKRQVTDYELAYICKCLSVTPNELLGFDKIQLE
jgi:transcriptional regulator with XRE-family HTH domain